MGRPQLSDEAKRKRKEALDILHKNYPGRRITMCKHQRPAEPVPDLPWYNRCPVCHKDVRRDDTHPHWIDQGVTTHYTPPQIRGEAVSLF